MPRRRPQFLQAVEASKQLSLKIRAMQTSKIEALSDAGRNKLSSSFVYIKPLAMHFCEVALLCKGCVFSILRKMRFECHSIFCVLKDL